MTQRTCSIEGCDRKHDARGLCNMHRLRVYHHGDPTIVLPNGKGDDIGYAAAHERKVARVGDAASQRCVTCGLPASDWAYAGGCLREKQDERGRRYSPDPDRYQAMCRPCHRRLDGVATGERNGRSKLTAAQVAEIRTGAASGADLARRFGVTRGAISMIRTGHNWKAPPVP